MKSWAKISVAVLLTAMICVPVTATVMGTESYTLNVAGSTTVQPLMAELQKEFEKFANVKMYVTGGGSGVGISSTVNGISDIGMLSRDLKESEKEGLDEHHIAKDAVVVIVNASAGVDDVSLEDLAKIYSGELTNWNQVKNGDGTGTHEYGNNVNIAVMAREEGSGTRDCFETALKTADKNFKMKERDVNAVNSTGAVLSAVETTPGAIGYINLNVSDNLPEKITKVKVDGVDAVSETILDGSYEISRDLILVTNGAPAGMTKFFIDWVMSEEGQNIVERSGFVRIDG